MSMLWTRIVKNLVHNSKHSGRYSVIKKIYKVSGFFENNTPYAGHYNRVKKSVWIYTICLLSFCINFFIRSDVTLRQLKFVTIFAIVFFVSSLFQKSKKYWTIKILKKVFWNPINFTKYNVTMKRTKTLNALSNSSLNSLEKFLQRNGLIPTRWA